jgi:hypothetical protein
VGTAVQGSRKKRKAGRQEGKRDNKRTGWLIIGIHERINQMLESIIYKPVGVAVGSAVGVAVGSAVGIAVGSAVGIAVGAGEFPALQSLQFSFTQWHW